MSLFAHYCLPRGAGATAAAGATRGRGASWGLLPRSPARSGARPSRGGSPPLCVCAPSEGYCCLAGGSCLVKVLNQGNFTKGGSRERSKGLVCRQQKLGGEKRGEGEGPERLGCDGRDQTRQEGCLQQEHLCCRCAPSLLAVPQQCCSNSSVLVEGLSCLGLRTRLSEPFLLAGSVPPSASSTPLTAPGATSGLFAFPG